MGSHGIALGLHWDLMGLHGIARDDCMGSHWDCTSVTGSHGVIPWDLMGLHGNCMGLHWDGMESLHGISRSSTGFPETSWEAKPDQGRSRCCSCGGIWGMRGIWAGLGWILPRAPGGAGRGCCPPANPRGSQPAPLHFQDNPTRRHRSRFGRRGLSGSIRNSKADFEALNLGRTQRRRPPPSREPPQVWGSRGKSMPLEVPPPSPLVSNERRLPLPSCFCV